MLFGVVIAGEDSQIPVESAGLLTIAFLVFYHILMWTAFSATPGKMMLRLQIVDRNGWRIGIVQSIGRLFGYGISTLCLGLGFVWIFVNRFGRGWHDYMAGTYVVYEGDSKPRAHNMAGDFFQDLAGGPPRIRKADDTASATTAAEPSEEQAQETARRSVRIVEVESAATDQAERRVIGDYPVAGFSRRLMAFGLDMVVSLFVSMAALFVLSTQIPPTPEGFVGEDHARQDAIRFSIIASLAIGYLVYPVISNWMFKSTAGKRIMNLQVVDLSGKNVGLSSLLIRHVGYLVSTPPLFMGFISALYDTNSQSWHDKIAKTYVTYTGGGRISDQAKARRPLTKVRRPGRSHWPIE